jgi:pyridoxal phosphate enzyme (YggS family)
MIDVRENCFRILNRIHTAAVRSGRDPASIRLIAVTKTVPPESIRLAAECGIRDVGENRLQEALPKMEALAALGLTWHFIGHLQTNKAKKAAEHFDWIQCIDRMELAQKLNAAASQPKPVLIEVKLHEEPNKSGVEESELAGLVKAFQGFERLRLMGLMAIPPFFEDPEETRPYFRRLHTLARQYTLPEVSMGMSNDFEVAIEEGATMVRIGSALFGSRP